MRRKSVWLAALLGALVLAPAAGADMDGYHPRYRTGESLAPLAEAAMAGDGSVAVDGNTGALVLIGSAAAIAQARALLALQDRKLRTVFVQTETRSARELSASGYDVAWSVGGNSARVGNVERGGSGVRVGVHEGRAAGAGSHGNTIRVLEGEWGRIASGAEVLLPTGSHRYPGAVRVAAQSGLEVRPRILGDGRVRLDFRRFQARLGTELGPGVVQRSGADTTLVVVPGQTAVVGGIGRSGQATSGSLAGRAAQGSAASESLLLVTVTVDEAAGAGAR